MKLNDKVINIVENKDFSINEVEKQGEDFYVELGQYTPCGEDWWETIWFDGTDDGFIEAVRERYNNFDVDEEAEIWIEGRGKNGVPDSIKDLVEDAEWKKSILRELADELEELELINYKDFEFWNKEKLWKLRKEICLGSLYINHYENSYGIPEKVCCDFFDGFIEDCWNIESEEENGLTEWKDILNKYDNAESLWDYFYGMECPFGD